MTGRRCTNEVLDLGGRVAHVRGVTPGGGGGGVGGGGKRYFGAGESHCGVYGTPVQGGESKENSRST